MADHLWYSNCAKCGIVHRKRDMRPIYSASASSMPPHLLCFLCQNCYCNLLDEWEIGEK
jgi:hypothetical protein